MEAIETIIEQGEGHKQPSKQDPIAEDDDDHEVAHYDQFVAICGYLDAGVIDPAKDVWPLVKNPSRVEVLDGAAGGEQGLQRRLLAAPRQPPRHVQRRLAARLRRRRPT